ncbi:hypothetical protein P175DRAFT_0522232 [Aspergillus ochraceoroseus IBT 24754]|nr:uncharacterized protein P175DRAFT_0522232 [Aspergillus ochraceoroseus IBT 24754]PTU23177.1 hypothetical protein P175DRAFT_0522232 [Aspergillus ochraceoroseus IBT 24754]
MSEYDSPTSSSTWGSGSGVGRERGARRKKVFEYLKAANELRQSYTAQWSAQRSGMRDYSEDYFNTPGAFPDVEIARAGDEEMVIFPSYARRLVKHKATDASFRQRRGSNSTIDEYRGISDEREPGLAEWEEFEDENAVVAVDVRGWVYAPNRGPMTRKHRLAIALARKLSGIPAPTNPPPDAEGSNQDGDRLPKLTEKREQDLVDTEAQSIIKNVEKGNELGWKGAQPDELDEDPAAPGRPQRTPTMSSSVESVQLTKDEISVANAHLMERMRPFLTTPMTGMGVTVFFFNDNKSQSRNILTNESGHFSLRASLPFVPTHVRILASEELSAVKDIQVIEPTGVSLISDIDDTVKHSAITSGAKEIFRNVFIRELGELKIDGVADWYHSLVDLGVQVHYVSNAPWQLYPLLERYFKLVELPPGSFHLKQYSGMLQGIFEPTVEKKKGTLEQIFRDFPERKFILVGDSGEADLEAYTDIVMANPGRVLGVFIRDITTPERKKFFETSMDHLENTSTRSRSTPELMDHSDTMANRPTLPPRPPRVPSEPGPETKSLESMDLIDLSDEAPQEPPAPTSEKLAITRTPPTIPSKPSSLRSVTNTNDIVDKTSPASTTMDAIKRKPAPPIPRRLPSESNCSSQPRESAARYSPSGALTGAASGSDERTGVKILASQLPSRTRPAESLEASDCGTRVSKQPPPPPPPRRSNTGSLVMSSNSSGSNIRPLTPQRQQSLSFEPTTTSPSSLSTRQDWPPPPRSALRSTASNPDVYSPSRRGSMNSSANPPAPLPNKREELWRRRWERATAILGDRGVVLSSWRVGKDAQDVSLWLVKDALKDMKGDQPASPTCR